VTARWLLLAFVGAGVNTVCDHLHVTHGVLWYPHPAFWSQAWWVPLLFAGATVAAIAGVEPVRALLGGRPLAPPTGRALAGEVLAYVSAYSFTAFGQAQPDVVLGFLVAAWVARVVAGAPAWVIVFSLLTAVVGPLFEAAWSRLGFFNYYHPDALGVARWLPGLYLHAGLVAVPVAALLRRPLAGEASRA
jgi:hypothetical protein